MSLEANMKVRVEIIEWGGLTDEAQVEVTRGCASGTFVSVELEKVNGREVGPQMSGRVDLGSDVVWLTTFKHPRGLPMRIEILVSTVRTVSRPMLLPAAI